MELCKYWPEFMGELLELKALASAEQSEIDDALETIRVAPENFYISTLTAEGAKRWEQMLCLPIQQGGALDDRRFRILSKMTEQRPFTMRTLDELLRTLCGADGFTVVCVGASYSLVVRVALTAKQNFDDVDALLNRVVPANMVIDLSLLYNQHKTMALFTHAQLAQYRHYQLRNEVIEHGN